MKNNRDLIKLSYSTDGASLKRAVQLNDSDIVSSTVSPYDDLDFDLKAMELDKDIQVSKLLKGLISPE